MFISIHHKEIDDTYATSKAMQLKVQGEWTRWLNHIQKNTKRWKITNEAYCFLCNKDACTTSHILGACKVDLSQGRFTFHYDNILKIIISNSRSSFETSNLQFLLW